MYRYGKVRHCSNTITSVKCGLQNCLKGLRREEAYRWYTEGSSQSPSSLRSDRVPFLYYLYNFIIGSLTGKSYLSINEIQERGLPTFFFLGTFIVVPT